jgi:hypothetical protein
VADGADKEVEVCLGERAWGGHESKVHKGRGTRFGVRGSGFGRRGRMVRE